AGPRVPLADSQQTRRPKPTGVATRKTPGCRQAKALFLIAPMIAVSMAPPAPPAIACEMMPPMLRSPDCAAATIDGSNAVTIWPSTQLPTKPETMLPIIPRSKVGEDLPAPTPPSAPAIRLIKICSMLISQSSDSFQVYPFGHWASSFQPSLQWRADSNQRRV